MATPAPAHVSTSILRRRWKKFRSLKRGYYSLIILTSVYALSFLLPLLINNVPLVIRYNGDYHFPAFAQLVGLSHYHSPQEFGLGSTERAINYRELDEKFEADGGENFIIMPPYPYAPDEDFQVPGNGTFMKPFQSGDDGYPRFFGTDDRARDVFARMAYGLNVSLSFAILLATLEYLIGIPIGALSGYFGGKFDLFLQRFVEVWSTLPVLFIIIIIVSLFGTSFFLLLTLLLLVSWISIGLYVRAEFLRERSKDYVAAAVSIGVPTRKIILRHILPNSLVPIITFYPFAVVAGITSLVSLDFLGFGLPPGTPSWGEMFRLGIETLSQGNWWIIVAPMLAMFFTLTLTVFIGEGVREAFDPRTYSRLR
ncbi:MAG TPA: ABC transporter permease subunit [Chlorobiota bacterium]|nr:ABC transporter permease subunit [Chlorobiota bacterium]